MTFYESPIYGGSPIYDESPICGESPIYGESPVCGESQLLNARDDEIRGDYEKLFLDFQIFYLLFLFLP